MNRAQQQLGSRLTLDLRPDKIDERHRVRGKAPTVAADFDRRNAAGGIDRRHYQLTGKLAAARVQLNRGDEADDARRLRDIAEELLAPPEAANEPSTPSPLPACGKQAGAEPEAKV